MYKYTTSLLSALFVISGALLLTTEKVSAVSILSNQSATIRWTSLNVQPGTCTASNSYAPGVWSGVKADNDGGAGYTYTIPANTFPSTVASYTFTIQCLSTLASQLAGAPVSAQDTINVTGGPNVSLSFTQTSANNPYHIIPSLSFTSDKNWVDSSLTRDYAQLSWNYSDTSRGSCVASGAWSGTKTTQGTTRLYNDNRLSSPVDKTYSLTCTSPNETPVTETLAAITFEAYEAWGGGCFTAGTKVLMANGYKKNIEDVTLDDSLMTSGGSQEVMKTYRIAYKGKLYAFNNSGKHFVTPTHPFMTTEGWKSLDPAGTRRESPGIIVSKLSIGDNLVLENNRYMTLTSLDAIATSTTVYNFGVNGTHDFYADGYLVHNVSMKDIFEKAYALPVKDLEP